MGEETDTGHITVLSFGPLAETLGRIRNVSLDAKTVCRQIIIELGIENWIENGLTIAINGKMAEIEETIHPGDELALLPPVSGG